MDLSLALLGLVGLAIVLAFVHVVSKMASERESAERRRGAASHKQKRVVPFSDDTLTHLGHS